MSLNPWHSRIAVLVLLLCVAPLRALGDDSSNPCGGIEFQYVEILRPQGFFGAVTPKANPDLVYKALLSRVEEDRLARDALLDLPLTQEGRELKKMGEKYIFQSLFNLAELCTFAKAKKFKRLNVVCVGDTGDEYMVDRQKYPDYVELGCFLSTYTGKKVDEDLYHDKIWGDFPNQRNYISEGGNRHDELAKQPLRQSAYSVLIREVVNNLVSTLKHPELQD